MQSSQRTSSTRRSSRQRAPISPYSPPGCAESPGSPFSSTSPCSPGSPASPELDRRSSPLPKEKGTKRSATQSSGRGGRGEKDLSSEERKDPTIKRANYTEVRNGIRLNLGLLTKFIQSELKIIHEKVMANPPITSLDWDNLTDSYNRWARANNRPLREPNSIKTKLRKLAKGPSTGGGELTTNQKIARQCMKAISVRKPNTNKTPLF